MIKILLIITVLSGITSFLLFEGTSTAGTCTMDRNNFQDTFCGTDVGIGGSLVALRRLRQHVPRCAAALVS